MGKRKKAFFRNRRGHYVPRIYRSHGVRPFDGFSFRKMLRSMMYGRDA